MRFKVSAPLEDFAKWLTAHYFVEYKIIHKFELKASADGRQFYQYGTPKPPIIILRIFVKETNGGVDVKLVPFDRPGNDPDKIFEFMHSLAIYALTDSYLKPTSLQPKER